MPSRRSSWVFMSKFSRWELMMEETMAERARQLGTAFTMKRFFDEVNAVGMIPVSLVYWELTGDDRMVRELRNGSGPLPFR